MGGCHGFVGEYHRLDGGVEGMPCGPGDTGSKGLGKSGAAGLSKLGSAGLATEFLLEKDESSPDVAFPCLYPSIRCNIISIY